MSKIIVDSIEPNSGKEFSINGNVNINGELNANNVASNVRKTLAVHPSWGKNANEFEFIFETYNWATIGDPTSVRKPFSTAINPKTGNDYRTDFLKNIDNIVTHTRLVWMDGHPSKYFDWNYSYWDLQKPNSFCGSTVIFGLTTISKKGNNTPISIQLINNPSPGGLVGTIPPPQQPNTFVATMSTPNQIVVYYDDTNGLLSSNDFVDALNLANLNVAYGLTYINATSTPIAGGVQNLGPVSINYSIDPGVSIYRDGLFLTNTFGINAWNNTTIYAVGTRVRYNGFIWECVTTNSNQTPAVISAPSIVYWHNTGIPENTGFNYQIPTYFNTFRFNQFNNQTGQNLFSNANGGYINGVTENWNLTKGSSNNFIGKKPVITLNVFMNTTNSNRYDFNPARKFDAAYQVEMLSAIEKEVLTTEYIQLGSMSYIIGNCIPGPIPPNPFSTGGIADGFVYGKDMINYTTEIRTNVSQSIRNSKIIIQSTPQLFNATNPGAGNWPYDFTNPLNQTTGFIHGFYASQQGNPTIYDFDIISYQTDYSDDSLHFFYWSLINTAPNGSWATKMGPRTYQIMKNTIRDGKIALSLYGNNLQNKIKYLYRFVSCAATPPLAFPVPPNINFSMANNCWATQTGVFITLILTATDRDFMGFQFNSLIDYVNCNLSCLYSNTNTFGPNTTDVMDYTPTGWMFNTFLNYFKKENGAISYHRILTLPGGAPMTGIAWGNANDGYAIDPLENVIGVYIVSTGVNNKKHRIIICNYNMDENFVVNLNLSSLITAQMTNVQFQKIYTPVSIYEPINWYRPGGTYETAIFDPPYTPNFGQINSTLIDPREYLMITAD